MNANDTCMDGHMGIVQLRAQCFFHSIVIDFTEVAIVSQAF
jgi:hypothetical protein